MEIQAPKKERKFLKSIGRIAGVLAQELVLGLGRKYIGKMINKIKIPKKRETLSFLLLLSCTFAFAQYPVTGNKQRLGYQTTGDGLVFRGRSSDTTALKPSTINNAYHLFDTVNNVLFSYIKTKGGWKFNNSDTVIIYGVTMPFDSITFNTAKDGTVGVGEVEYNDSQGSLIQGLKGGNVTNVIGQQLHQRVSNVTGSTLSKGTAVYLSGSQGNRITAAKALATSDPTSANTFGIVAESIADNASGYVITEGLITGINTSGLTEDSAVYLSPTVAGGLTSTKPQAPNHGVYIGVCVKTNAGSGELFVKIKNGLELDELHDVLITSPASNASLYYSGGLWRDTTAALLVSDTASMLSNYNSRINLKLNIADTSSMLTNYLRSGVAALTYLTQSNALTTYTPLTRLISTTSPLQGGGDLSANRTLSILQSSSTVNGYLSSTDWTTFNGKQAQLNGTGFVKASGTSISYDNSNYLTTSSAASTYLPLTGGTLTGSLNGTIGTFTTRLGVGSYTGSPTLFTSGSGDQEIHFTHSDNVPGRKVSLRLTNNNSVYYTYGGLIYVLEGQGLNEYSRMTLGINTNEILHLSRLSRVGIMNDSPSYTLDVNGTLNATGAATLSSTLAVTGETTLSNLSGSGTRMVTASSTGVLSTQTIPSGGGGTVTNVTGVAPISVINNTTTPEISVASATGSVSGVVTTSAQTFAGTKTFTGNAIVNGSLTVNEDGSSVGVFRVEGDNNTSLIQTAPASDYVGIGRVPENSFDVQGAVRFRTLTLNGTPTRIIGADATGDINQITLGSGLSLSSGTLSATATGTVTSVTGTAPIVSSGGTTPVISVNAATSSASGVVSATTQSFGGNKTFTGIVGLNKVLQRPVETITVSSASITTGSTWIIVNNAGTVTLTLPSASTSTGTEYFIKTITNNTVVSASSNIVPLTGGSASTPILSGTAGKWATLVSDGSNWVIMQAN